MYLSKSGRAIAPYPPFPTALQVGPFILLYSPTIFMASSLSTTFKPDPLSNLSFFHGDFFQFQFGFRTRRTDNMIVSRIFIAAAIILPYVLSFPLENDLSVSVKYLEQLENRIHNLEAPGM